MFTLFALACMYCLYFCKIERSQSHSLWDSTSKNTTKVIILKLTTVRLWCKISSSHSRHFHGSNPAYRMTGENNHRYTTTMPMTQTYFCTQSCNNINNIYKQEQIKKKLKMFVLILILKKRNNKDKGDGLVNSLVISL